MTKKIISGKRLFELNLHKTFKLNDHIKRARQWSEDRHLRYGGLEKSVPIGTKGIVRDALSCQSNREYVLVEFDSGPQYQMHPAELDLLNEVKIKHKIKW